MSRETRWCAICVEKQHEEFGRFDGFRGLNPATTVVGGTKVCGVHVEEARLDLDEVRRIERRVKSTEDQLDGVLKYLADTFHAEIVADAS